MTISGTCHCGGVTLAVARVPDEITQCGCSICKRLGVLWAYYPVADVSVTGATATYVCNKRVISFHHCPTCGCTTHWETRGKDFGRIGTNARLLDVDLSTVPVSAVSGPA